MKTFFATIYSPPAARALNEESHISQVHVFGVANSKAAFSRALTDAGLFSNAAAALREINFSGGETGNVFQVTTATAAPDKVFVTGMNSHAGDPVISWPQEG